MMLECKKRTDGPVGLAHSYNRVLPNFLISNTLRKLSLYLAFEFPENEGSRDLTQLHRTPGVYWLPLIFQAECEVFTPSMWG